MSKHYDPKFRWLRGKKIERPTVKFNVPGYKRTEEELRMMYRERGVFPTQVTQDVPIYIGSTSGIIDEYIPQEGDGKYSILSNKVSLLYPLWLQVLRVSNKLLIYLKFNHQ